MWLLFSALSSTAWAQSSAVSPAITPPLNAQLYAAPFDSTETLWTDLTDVRPGASASLLFEYLRDPLVYVRGDSRDAVLADVVQANVLAAYGYKSVRLGVDLPLMLYTDNSQGPMGAGLGDLRLDLKASVLKQGSAPLGLAMAAGLGLPSATVNAPLGAAGATGAVRAIVDHRFGSLVASAELGTLIGPEVQLDNVVLNDAFLARLGVGYAWSDAGGLSLDLGTQLAYSAPLSNPAGRPVEAILGAWTHLSRSLLLRGGLGRGLGIGVGAPGLRALLGLSYVSSPDDQHQPQPNPLAPVAAAVSIQAVDDAGQPVPQATVHLSGDGGELDGQGSASGLLPVGTYQAKISAEGYAPSTTTLSLAGEDLGQQVTRTIVLEALLATVDLQVHGADERPMADAHWRLDNVEQCLVEDGALQAELPAGHHRLSAWATGSTLAELDVELARGEHLAVDLVLTPSKATVRTDRIDPSGRIYCDLDQATLTAQSVGTLRDLASALLEHSELTRVRVEGHTDSRGDAAYNLGLSKARAAAVVTWLVEHGIAPDRLDSDGFGEERPLVRAEKRGRLDKESPR